MGFDGWQTLEPGLLGHVIRILQSDGLWRRDGASMRRVCRYWCLEVDRCLLSIEPRHSRVIAPRDLASLSKFTRLTTLDATPFVRAYEPSYGPCSGLLSVLALKRLKLSSESWNSIGVTALTSLTGLKSLTLMTRYAVHVPESHLRLLSRLPLEELSLRCPVSRMQPFFCRRPSVTRLEALVLPGERSLPDDLEWLSGVAALKLDFCPVGHDFEPPNMGRLSYVSSLTALDISSFVSSELDYLNALLGLTHLEASIATTEIASTASFRRVLHRLRRLGLHGVSPLDLGGILRSATQLTSLRLDGFSLDAASLKPSCLEQLSLRNCRLLNAQSCFNDMTTLGALSYDCLRDPFSQLRLGDANLSRLTKLKVRLNDVDGITVISRLRTLDVLCLQTRDPLSVPALRRLGCLDRLTQLGVSPAFPESATSVFLGLALMQKMEVLYLGEAESFNASSLNMIKESVPYLVVETDAKAFDDFMRKL